VTVFVTVSVTVFGSVSLSVTVCVSLLYIKDHGLTALGE
jgi:hypothetical protein